MGKKTVVAQKKEELSNKKKYEQVVKKKILEYARRNKKELCRKTMMLDYVANEYEVQKAKKNTGYKDRFEAYTFEDLTDWEDEIKQDEPVKDVERKADASYYEGIFDRMMEALIKEGKILKVKKPNTKKIFYYTYAAPKPSISSIENREIAVFRVKDGNVKVAADIVNGNLKKESKDKKIDLNIGVTVAGRYLLCGIKDLEKYNQEVDQLSYIREHVKKALELAGCTIEIKE